MKIKAAIIDNEGGLRRDQLKSALHHAEEITNVKVFTGVGQALADVDSGEGFQLCFISESIPEDEFTAFLNSCRSNESVRDAAIIKVVAEQMELGTEQAKDLLNGADGEISQPFSVEKLLELAELTKKLQSERQKERECAAMEIMLKEMMGKLDLLASFKRAGYEAETSQEKFGEACSVLGDVDIGALRTYFQVALDKFEIAEVPDELDEHANYQGRSSRVKKRMEQKLMRRLEEELAKENDS